MTRITNADQVLLLLRGHLQRAERSQRKRASQKPDRRENVKRTPMERMQSIARTEALQEHEIHQALIHSILTEEFGSAAANDPKFQLMVDEVLRMIREEPKTRALLTKAADVLVADRK